MSSVPFKDRISCTVPEATEATGLGHTKLYELINDGKIESFKIGSRRLIKVESLRKLSDDTA